MRPSALSIEFVGTATFVTKYFHPLGLGDMVFYIYISFAICLLVLALSVYNVYYNLHIASSQVKNLVLS